jgi:hypothetical protein
MPDKINLDSSGLQRSDCSVVLSWRDKVYSHSTKCLKSVKRSSEHACLVLFSSFCAIGAELKCGVHSHQVLAKSSSSDKINLDSSGLKSVKQSSEHACLSLAQSSSTKLVSCNTFASLVCEPVTSTNQVN